MPKTSSGPSRVQSSICTIRVSSTEVSPPSLRGIQDADLADLKPENILFKSKAEDAELALADFGVSCSFSVDTGM
jgi:hypothetical protein